MRHVKVHWQKSSYPGANQVKIQPAGKDESQTGEDQDDLRDTK